MMRLSATAILLAATLTAGSSPVLAQDDTANVPITVQVQPMAEISFPVGGTLHLYVPPASQTVPDDGLPFTVTGNAMASVSAAPEEYLFVAPFIQGMITNPAGRWLGLARHSNGQLIGFNLAVEFPADGFSIRYLPNANGGSTEPLPADVSGGAVLGFLHMVASHRWTPNATMPSLGDYHGNIIVTLTANL